MDKLLFAPELYCGVYTHFAHQSNQPTVKMWEIPARQGVGVFPPGVYMDVHEIGNTDHNAVLRCIYTFRLFKATNPSLKWVDTSKTRKARL